MVSFKKLEKLEKRLNEFRGDLGDCLDGDVDMGFLRVARPTKAILEHCIQITLMVANHLPAMNKREQAYSLAMGKCLEKLDLDAILDGSAMAVIMGPIFQETGPRASKEAANG